MRSTPELSPDVDRGWAFVVLVCGWLTSVLSLGFLHASAVFYTTLLEEFEEAPARTAWALSLPPFLLNFGGEMANALLGLIGARATIAVGCALSSGGMIACCFAPSLVWVLVAHGIFTGVGFALAYFPHYTVIVQYFSRYRAIAFAVCSAGSGAGQLMLSPLMRVLIDKLHWRGAFLVLAAVNLHFFVVAAAVMPPRQATAPVERQLLMSPSRSPHRALARQLRQLLLFRRPIWLLLCFSILLTRVGMSAFFAHIANYAVVLGHGKLRAAFLQSVVGVGSLCGRLAVGVVAQQPRVHVAGLNLMLFATLGVVSAACGLVHSYAGLVVCSALVGLCAAACALFPELIIHAVGPDSLASGASYGCAFAAVGFLLGSPVAAWLFEVDPTYRLSFCVCGAASVVGSALVLPLWFTCRNGRLRLKQSAERDPRPA